MTSLIAFSVLFVAVHVLPASPLRPLALARIGEAAYLGVFSLASIGLLVAMVMAYNAAGPGEPLYAAGTGVGATVLAGMLVAFWFAVAANSERNAASVGGGASLAASGTPSGVFTITRHPLMTAIAIFAALHLIANPDPPSLVFFGALLITAIGGAWLQDRRKEREIGAAWRCYRSMTSGVPFAAIAAGRVKLDLGDFVWWRIALTLALWIGFAVLHGAIIGVPAFG